MLAVHSVGGVISEPFRLERRRTDVSDDGLSVRLTRAGDLGSAVRRLRKRVRRVSRLASRAGKRDESGVDPAPMGTDSDVRCTVRACWNAAGGGDHQTLRSTTTYTV